MSAEFKRWHSVFTVCPQKRFAVRNQQKAPLANVIDDDQNSGPHFHFLRIQTSQTKAKWGCIQLFPRHTVGFPGLSVVFWESYGCQGSVSSGCILDWDIHSSVGRRIINFAHFGAGWLNDVLTFILSWALSFCLLNWWFLSTHTVLLMVTSACCLAH